MGMTPNYSPIIAAMVANAKQQTENNQQILEAQRQKDEVAHQKVQDAAQSRNLDLLQSHNDALAEHNKGMLSVAQQQAEAQEEMNRLTRAKQAYEVSKFLPHLNETLNSMGGKSIAGLPSQAEAQKNEISQIHDQAMAHSSGTAEGSLVTELQLGEAKHNQDLESKLQDHAHRMLQIGAEGGNSQNLAKIHGGYQQSVANINGANHLRGITLMHSLGQDDGSGQQASQIGRASCR